MPQGIDGKFTPPQHRPCRNSLQHLPRIDTLIHRYAYCGDVRSIVPKITGLTPSHVAIKLVSEITKTRRCLDSPRANKPSTEDVVGNRNLTNISESGLERIHKRLNRKRQLSKLQARIAPPVRAIDRKSSDILQEVTGRTERSADAFRRYLDVSLEDAQLAAVVHGYSLNESALHRIYVRLINAGMDQWVRGQHVGLASIANPETLLFIARARQRKRSWDDIANGLRRYFRREYCSRELLAKA